MYRSSTVFSVVTLLLIFSIPVSAAQISLADEEWALLTVPANADEQTVESLFGDDLPINTLGVDWVIYLFDQASQNYIAPTRSDSLTQGAGFWIIQSTGASVVIDVPDTLPPGDALMSSACASAAGCFPADLSTPGRAAWAIVGAPHNQAITVGDIRVQSNEQQCSSGCTLNNAGSAGLLANNQWVYTGSAGYRSLAEIGALQPWQAFWVASAAVSGVTELTILLPTPSQGPGAVIETHHESFPNPAHNSGFRVSASCKLVTQPCNWDNPGTWQNGSVPNSNTLVIVDGQVQIRNQQAIARSVGVYPGGNLSFATTVNTELRTADLMVLEGGTLEIGTEGAPIGSAYRAEVIFLNLPFDASDTEQHLRGLVAIDGVVRVFGHTLNEAFIRTKLEPAQGDTDITLTQSATAAGWRVGDSVVFPTSTQCTGATTSCADLTEDRTISAISPNGLTLTLNQALQFDHPGARSHTGVLDFTPHVINKSRNVVFRSENPNGVRAHMLFHGRSDVDIRYANITSLGRTDIRDLGPTNQKGRYALHAHHLIGPSSAQTNGYQFTLIGNLVDLGVENRTQDRKWGISIHGSHFGLIENNVVDYASGAGLVLESGSEMGNLIKENFVVRVVGGNGLFSHDPDPSDGSKLGRSGSAFWFNGGGRNFFESNVAAAIEECIFCYGFKFDNVYNGDLLFPVTQGSDPHMTGGEIINAHTIGLNNFTDNEAYAVPNGLTIWWECSFGSFPNDNCSSRIDGFNLWHHHRWGYHGYPTNNLTLANFVMRGDPSALNNIYEAVVGMDFGDYMHRNLVVENADIQNVRTGINLTSMRHERGAVGPDVGFNTVVNSYLVATTGVGVWAPSTVHGADDLSPQTSVFRNVRFDYPNIDLTGQELRHIVMHDTSLVLNPDKMNQELRNDVWVYDYNTAPGVDGDDLYIIPDYQGPARCDNSIGRCAAEITANYLPISKGHIYPLR